MKNTTRRDFLKKIGLGIAALNFVGCSAVKKQQKEQSNILFIFADDQAFDTINALGYNDVQTPNLNRLVKNGVTFTHAYNMGAWHGAVCVASRTMLNIGRFLWESKNLEPDLKGEQIAGRFWSQYMSQAGYETYMSGKWHVKGIKPKDIFDNVKDVRPGMPNQTEDGYNRPIEGQPDPWTPWDTKYEGFWKGGKHWSEVLGDHAVNFLDQAGDSEKPFFMYLAFNAPHDPRQSPKEFVDKYPLENISVPENFYPEYPYKDSIGCEKTLRDERLAPFPRTKYAVKKHRQEYYAIITHMDKQVGRILDALEASGKADNTYIFFTADHGLAVGHHGLMGKQNMFDHSVRVPLIVTGPEIKKNSKIAAPVYLQDIMPSTLELAGIEKPDHVKFKSLMPLINGKREFNYKLIYGGYRHLQRMICDGEYKLIYYPKIDRTILYNMKDDPLEQNDLATDAKYFEKIEELKVKLKQLQKEYSDPILDE
jgi:arylsulfatase A-like enzyme